MIARRSLGHLWAVRLEALSLPFGDGWRGALASQSPGLGNHGKDIQVDFGRRNVKMTRNRRLP